MRIFLALGLTALLCGCPNYGTPAGHWPPDVTADAGAAPDMGSVVPTDDGGSGAQDAAVPVADAGQPAKDAGVACDAGKPADAGKRDCDGDCDACTKKCKQDHDDRDKDGCDRHQQCRQGCRNDDDRKQCDRDDDDRQKQCGDKDKQCVLKCKKDKDDCDKDDKR